MTLYFIASDDGSMNLDLLAMAKSPADALRYWRKYYELESDATPDRVFAVKPPKRVGAIDWHSPACHQVAGTRPEDASE